MRTTSGFIVGSPPNSDYCILSAAGPKPDRRALGTRIIATTPAEEARSRTSGRTFTDSHRRSARGPGTRGRGRPCARARAAWRNCSPAAESLTLAGHGRTVTYSRKVFIPLTQLCRDVCHYCTFAQAPRALRAALPEPRGRCSTSPAPAPRPAARKPSSPSATSRSCATRPRARALAALGFAHDARVPRALRARGARADRPAAAPQSRAS